MSLFARFNDRYTLPSPEVIPAVEIQNNGVEFSKSIYQTPTALGDYTLRLIQRLDEQKEHIWTSSEQQQVAAASSWLASSRLSIAHSLMNSAIVNGYVSDTLRVVAEENRDIAQGWINMRDEIELAGDFRLQDMKTLTTGYSWPRPEQVDEGLFRAIAELVGQGNPLNVSELLDDAEYRVAGVLDEPYIHPYFKKFRRIMEIEGQKLSLEREHLSRFDFSVDDVSHEPARSVYLRMTGIIEKFMLHGVHRLVPATLDSTLRIREKTQEDPMEQPSLPVLDVIEVKSRRNIPKPIIDGFNPDSVLKQKPQVAKASLPAFDGLLLSNVQTQHNEDGSQLPEFDPNKVYSGKKSSSSQDVALPLFDPDNMINMDEKTGHSQESRLPVFDPNKLK